MRAVFSRCLRTRSAPNSRGGTRIRGKDARLRAETTVLSPDKVTVKCYSGKNYRAFFSSWFSVGGKVLARAREVNAKARTPVIHVNMRDTRHGRNVRGFRVTGRAGLIRADLIVAPLGRTMVSGSFTTPTPKSYRYDTNNSPRRRESRARTRRLAGGSRVSLLRRENESFQPHGSVAFQSTTVSVIISRVQFAFARCSAINSRLNRKLTIRHFEFYSAAVGKFSQRDCRGRASFWEFSELRQIQCL